MTMRGLVFPRGYLQKVEAREGEMLVTYEKHEVRESLREFLVV